MEGKIKMKRGMNQERKRREDLKTNYYVDGNTVRRLEGEPEERLRRQLEKEQEELKRRNRHAAKRNRERTAGINLGYVLFCSMAVVLLCGVCGAYIQLQSDITGRTKRISKLEGQIMNLKADNDAAVKRIDLSTDLDIVKKQALGYGMQYARPDQVIYYSIESNDYMDQYLDIPEN